MNISKRKKVAKNCENSPKIVKIRQIGSPCQCPLMQILSRVQFTKKKKNCKTNFFRPAKSSSFTLIRELIAAKNGIENGITPIRFYRQHRTWSRVARFVLVQPYQNGKNITN
jgi:hypothetical protein